jgi:DNA-binding ferritin-like protein (Dps family)
MNGEDIGDSNEKNDEKNLKLMKKEIKRLQDDYKHCMEAIKKETHERTKAETIVKVLKETLDAQNVTDMEIDENKEHVDVIVEKENDTVKDVDNEWVSSRKRKHSIKKTVFPANIQKLVSCEICEFKFETDKKLAEHMMLHESRSDVECGKCELKFESHENLEKHMSSHEDMSKDKNLNCNKCERKYSNMGKLRRHDWRSHREIECNLCGVTIESRQQISQHRKSEHQMFRKIFCKFFPDCIDEDECIFEHEEGSRREGFHGCINGETCSDQSCQFSEASHKNVKNAVCRFQANCNRLNCAYKHSVQRKAFLGVCTSNSKGK